MESNDLRALSELYLKTVYEAKAESPEEEEEKDKEDDDLAGSPNKNGKKNGKKAKRWWDDDGDGKGYEKGEVDGKFPDKDGSKKKKVKEEVENLNEISADKALEASKAADVKRGKLAVAGDREGAAKKSAQAVRLYKAQAKKRLNREEVEVDEGYEEKKKSEVLSAMKKQGRKLSDKDKDKIANKVVASKGDTSKSDDRYAYEELDPGMEHNLSILRMLAEKEVNVKDTKKVVDAIRAYDKSKDASRDATDDSDKGDKEGAAVEKKYAAKERGEIKKDAPNWKNKKYHTGMHGEEVESLVASGKFSNEELMSIANLQEADIADILARLEKKRISKGGDPEESPLPAMRKYHADKKKKKVKEDYWMEFEEGYQRNPEKGEAEERKEAKKGEAIRGQARRRMPPRGNKDREEFERWYAANVR